MRAREYAGPLGVLAAGIIGFGLLCSVSGLAMSDLSRRPHTGVEPLNIVDLAVANLSTSAALTQQAVTAFVSTPTSGPTDPASLTPVFIPSDTSTLPVTVTATESSRTRRSRPSIPSGPGPTTTPAAPPPATSTPPPTLTDTPLPPPTNTLPPPPTDTEPPPTDTQPPPPTDTEPPPTATDPPIQVLEATPTPSP